MSEFTERLRELQMDADDARKVHAHSIANHNLNLRDLLVLKSLPALIEALEAAEVFEKDPNDQFKRNILWHKLDALNALVKEGK